LLKTRNSVRAVPWIPWRLWRTRWIHWILSAFAILSRLFKVGHVSDIARILVCVEQGDPKAAEELLPLVYEELRKLAAHKMAGEALGQTLQPTALVHEAWLRLTGAESKTWDSRGHFFAAAAEAMRRILIERARAKSRALSVVCDGSGNIYAVGDVRCIYRDGLVFCDPGLLGSFALPPQTDGSLDFFVARLTDPAAVAVELKIARTVSGVALSWPVQATNYLLGVSTSLPAVSWTTVTNTPTVTTNERSVQLPLTGDARFFRLRKP
jgi:ECF sigma factor